MGSRRDVPRRTVLGGAVAGMAMGTAAGPAAAQPHDRPGAEHQTGPRTAAVPTSAGALAADTGGEQAWRRVLADSDPVWRTLPAAWEEGPFLGNGFLGTGVYAEPGANAMRFTVQHSEVQDHRPEFGSTFGLARLPIGHLTLEPVGTVTGVSTGDPVGAGVQRGGGAVRAAHGHRRVRGRSGRGGAAPGVGLPRQRRPAHRAVPRPGGVGVPARYAPHSGGPPGHAERAGGAVGAAGRPLIT